MNPALDEEERSARLRQRLWGAAVLIALLVIVLPLVLDGSGSESQFRRVERLREEPPRVVGTDGLPEQPAPSETTQSAVATPVIRVGEDDPPDYLSRGADAGADAAVVVDTVVQMSGMTAWVVQAGSFSDETNAIAVRDRLRRAGFPSFVTEAEAEPKVYRVRVGPMIDESRARATRDGVVTLLGRDAIVVSYP